MSDNQNKPDDLFSMWANEPVEQERLNVTVHDDVKSTSVTTVTEKKSDLLRDYSKHISANIIMMKILN